MNTLNGYSKSTLTDNYVLTAAGGHLAVGNASGNIPLSNSTVNTDLNADLLDGLHGSWYLKNVLAFKLVKGTNTTGGYDLNTLTEGLVYNYLSSGYWKNGPSGMSYGSVLNLKNGSSNSLSGQLAWDVNHNNTTDTTRSLWWRASDNGTFANSQWHKIAFLESIPTVTNYYWADISISDTASTTTTPTFATATATTQVTTPKVHSDGRLTLNATSTGVDLKFNNDSTKSVILNGTAFKPFDSANDNLTLGSVDAKWSHIYAALTVNTPIVTSPGVLKINAGSTEVQLQIAATTTQSLVLNTTSFGPFKDADGLLSSGRSNARWSNIYSVLGNFTGSITIAKGNSIVDDGGLGIVGINPTGWTGLPSDGSAIGFGTGAAPVYIRTNTDNLYHYHKTNAQSYKILDANNSSVSDGGSTWGSKITVKINNVTKTLTIPAKPTDTQNTAGSTNNTKKLFLIGAESQTASILTYSNSKVYATDGVLNATNFISGTGVNDFSQGIVKLDTLLIPTSSGGSTFGAGNAGLVLKSNGSTVYWGSDNNSNTWRAIKTNGESLAGTGTDTRALNFEAGLGINIVGTAGSSDLLTDNNILITNTGMIGYDGSRHYRLLFALGAEDLAWKKIVEVRSLHTISPTVDTWEAVTIRGTIWYSDTNHYGNELIKFPFCAVFKYVEGTSIVNTADLYLPRYAKEYSCIRIVRRSTNRFELQVRQIAANLVGWIDYQVSGGGTINAYTSLQAPYSGVVIKLAADASILVEDRAYCVLDYNNTSTPIYIGYAGESLTTATYLAAYGTTSTGERCIKDISIETIKSMLTIPTLSSRNLTVNGTAYTFYSNTTTAAASFYAPTSVGSSDQILISSGSTSYPTPYWENRLTYNYPGIIWVGYIYRTSRTSTYYYAIKSGGKATLNLTSTPNSSYGYLSGTLSNHSGLVAAFALTEAVFSTATTICYAYSSINFGKAQEAGFDTYRVSINGSSVYIRACRMTNGNNSSWEDNGFLQTDSGRDGEARPIARFYLMIIGY